MPKPATTALAGMRTGNETVAMEAAPIIRFVWMANSEGASND